MAHNNYFTMNAWREIFARVFPDLNCKYNFSPEWLVNPATKSRLKLDLLYPDIGVAVRFEGLKASGQPRQSDQEAQETATREDTREEVCRAHGIALVRIDPQGEDVAPQIDSLVRAISHAGRAIDESERSAAEKAQWMPVIGAARSRALEIRGIVSRNQAQYLQSLSDAWRDRELSYSAPAPAPPAANGTLFVPAEEQRVRHERFGEGVVVALVDAPENDKRITILFDGEQQRTFLLSLVQGKLEPA
jgi:hypothetical protein